MSSLSNTGAYNIKGSTDLGQTLFGYYAEAGYNVLAKTKRAAQLIPFVRYEYYDVHAEVSDVIDRNESYRAEEVIVGLNCRVSTGVVFKSDLQMVRRGDQENFGNILNFGVGFWF